VSTYGGGHVPTTGTGGSGRAGRAYKLSVERLLGDRVSIVSGGSEDRCQRWGEILVELELHAALV